jgi:hypothetical protein
MENHLTKDDMLFLLHQACLLIAHKLDEKPCWVGIIAGANPDFLEEAVEIARDTYCLDETGEI